MRANKVSIALLLAVIATFAIGSETTNITKNVSICGVPLGTTYDSVAEMCEPAHAPQMFYRTFHYKGPNSPNTVVYDDNDRAKWLDGACPDSKNAIHVQPKAAHAYINGQISQKTLFLRHLEPKAIDKVLSASPEEVNSREI